MPRHPTYAPVIGKLAHCLWWTEVIPCAVGHHGRSRYSSIQYIDGLVQDCSISNANALEILQYCTKPSIYSCDLMTNSFIMMDEGWTDYLIMGAMASQIISLTIVSSSAHADQRNIKAPRRRPVWGEFTGDRWIPRTSRQYRGKCFHLMTENVSIWGLHIFDYLGLERCIRSWLYYINKSPHNSMKQPYPINSNYSDVTWASWRLKSPTTRLFAQELLQAK